MTDHEVTIAPPADGQVQRHAVMDVLALAFSSDPAVRYMFPDAATYLACFHRLATAMAADG